MKISVIGTGSIGRRHIGNFLSIGAAVTAFDADQAARERARGMHRPRRTPPRCRRRWPAPMA